LHRSLRVNQRDRRGKQPGKKLVRAKKTELDAAAIESLANQANFSVGLAFG